MANKKIPQKILAEVADILADEGGFVKYIGKYKGKEVYYAAIEGALTGFPYVYLFDGENVINVEPIKGLDITAALIKD